MGIFKKASWALIPAFFTVGIGLARAEKPLLLQQPTISRNMIVFVYAGDLWIVGRDGGDAHRLTTDAGAETNPFFSPDGNLIAFTGEYDGNIDVFTVPATGGVPRRLTHHPAYDEVVGWTPDGKRIVFRSSRGSFAGISRLYSVGLDGGFPDELPLPEAFDGVFSPDGSRFAYEPIQKTQTAWKRYQGGQTSAIWIVGMSDLKVEKIPRSNSNDSNPMWIGNKIYFLSDRSGAVTLYAYDLSTKSVTRVLENDGLDLKSAAAGPGTIIYEQFGSVRLFDTATGKSRPVNIHINGDMPEVRPHFAKPGWLGTASISPSGARAVFEARGEIVTVPAEKGNMRNLTRTTGIRERDPAWSPDGKWIAYFSDESGEYALHIREQDGKGEVRKISLGEPPSFFYNPLWSPDSRKIAYNDKRLNLWYMDLDKGLPVKVDTTCYFNPYGFAFYPSWSPDSRWLAYSKELINHQNSVYIYSLDARKSFPVTDGMCDARNAAFDRNGKYLYFTASTDFGLAADWNDMSSMRRPVTRSVYIMVLRKDLPSPLAPESDEETVRAASAAAPVQSKEPALAKVTIDLDGIGQRILVLPIPPRNYLSLNAGKEGIIFLQEGRETMDRFFIGNEWGPIHRFDLKQRKIETVLDRAGQPIISADGEKMLIDHGGWVIAPTSGSVEQGQKALAIQDMEVYIDPIAEWKQMYHEVWRIERDFFYDPGFHGLDLKAAEKKYLPYLEGIASRRDLNYLFDEMLGELTCGHIFVGGGDRPEVRSVPGGLLGADYRIENGRYRFSRIYNGENWNPELRAPLTQPGVNVAVGEYLLAVNGREIGPGDEIFAFFEGTADKQTTIRVGPNPNGSGSREVVVVPVADELGLRIQAWIEENRRKVNEMSGGRLAYVYISNTTVFGFNDFNRYYFTQVGKEGAVIDERYNGGGLIADYIIDYLQRPIMAYFTMREGSDYIIPAAGIFGPKAMIINEYAGSGGDALPWLFRAAGIGPLIGKRTWGGLVGFASGPRLMDEGKAGSPQSGFWNPNGTWDVENHGVSPDIEVEMDPAAVRDGRDPQLERTVSILMDKLEKSPLPKHKKPVYPDYHSKPWTPS